MPRIDRIIRSAVKLPSPNISTYSDTYKGTPWVSDELISYLDNLFPDRLPDPPSKKAMYKRIGWRDVISHLKTLHEAQTP